MERHVEALDSPRTSGAELRALRLEADLRLRDVGEAWTPVPIGAKAVQNIEVLARVSPARAGQYRQAIAGALQAKITELEVQAAGGAGAVLAQRIA